nr:MULTISPECIES: hypothetical protein [unclassified Mesorhizobium]
MADNFLGYRARLNICLAGSAENREFIGPQIRVIALDVRIAAEVAAARRPQRQELLAERLFMSCAVCPESEAGSSGSAEARVLGMLHDPRLQAVGMSRRHAEATGPP